MICFHDVFAHYYFHTWAGLIYIYKKDEPVYKNKHKPQQPLCYKLISRRKYDVFMMFLLIIIFIPERSHFIKKRESSCIKISISGSILARISLRKKITE